MTLKAVRIIEACSAIAVPQTGSGERVALGIAAKAVPALATKPVLDMDMPMTKDEAILRRSHEAAAETIIRELAQGRHVAFLTLGDPCIYSTYIYVHRIVRDRGYPTEIIPGVPSFCAVSAKLGDSLVDTSQPLHVLPATYGNLTEGLSLPGTKVLMKSGKAFAEVQATLSKMNLLSGAKMVVNCGMDGEKVVHTMDETTQMQGYFSIIVVKDNG